MRTIPRQVRHSLLLALVFGTAFIPAESLMGLFLPGSTAFRSTVWLCLGVYGVFLARKAGRSLLPLLFPLAILLALVFWESSLSLFLVVFMGVLSWIRSGICFPGQLRGKLPIELLLCGGGGLLVGLLSPASPLHMAMGIWLFFLVQSLYFLFAEEFGGSVHDESKIDRFEAARIQAETILKEL